MHPTSNLEMRSHLLQYRFSWRWFSLLRGIYTGPRECSSNFYPKDPWSWASGSFSRRVHFLVVVLESMDEVTFRLCSPGLITRWRAQPMPSPEPIPQKFKIARDSSRVYTVSNIWYTVPTSRQPGTVSNIWVGPGTETTPENSYKSIKTTVN